MKKYTKISVYKVITDQVIKGLKKEGLSWFKPWTNNDGEFVVPMSLKSGKQYQGINVLLLSAQMRANEWTRPEFITYKQAEELGGNVIKGQAGSEVIYWMVSYFVGKKWFANERALNKAGYKKTCKGVTANWSPRYFRVFNVEQCEGLKLTEATKPTQESIFVAIPDAELVFKGYNVPPNLSHGGNRAYYKPSIDAVKMPKAEAFVTTDDYYKTLFHELVHSTGHDTRLKRKGVTGINSFGSKDYSFEELIAEIGAMFLVAFTGINPKDADTNSQAYINGWISKLEAEEKWILQASGAAERAVKYILNK